jgi:hypothetical protein
MGEPRAVLGVPKPREGKGGIGRRKPVPIPGAIGLGMEDRRKEKRIAEVRQRLNGLALNAP